MFIYISHVDIKTDFHILTHTHIYILFIYDYTSCVYKPTFKIYWTDNTQMRVLANKSTKLNPRYN